MMKPINYENPEPVPSASQLLALPFVSAVAGYFVDAVKCGSVRVTLHRVMTRDGNAYLQQVCNYAGEEISLSKAGRLFIVDVGIIGKAFGDRAIVRTRLYDQETTWWDDYRADRTDVGDQSPEAKEPISYLALPFLDPAGDAIVCILYVEAGGLNHFAKGPHLDAVLGMSAGFCRVLDDLVVHPLPRIRNYPLPIGTPVGGVSTLYTRLQETVGDRTPPRLAHFTSFNFAPTP